MLSVLFADLAWHFTLAIHEVLSYKLLFCSKYCVISRASRFYQALSEGLLYGFLTQMQGKVPA